MAKLTLIKAAKVYGKSRTTLYRHVRNGKLSAEKRAHGDKDVYVVDLAELVRAYGEPPARDVAGTVAGAAPETRPTTALQAENAVLKEKLAAAEREVAASGEQVAWLREQFEAAQLQLTDRRRARGVFGEIRRLLVGDKP